MGVGWLEQPDPSSVYPNGGSAIIVCRPTIGVAAMGVHDRRKGHEEELRARTCSGVRDYRVGYAYAYVMNPKG